MMNESNDIIPLYIIINKYYIIYETINTLSV